MMSTNRDWPCGIALIYALLTVAGEAAAVAPGDIIVADDAADAIFVIDPTSGIQSLLSSGGQLSQPSGIAVDSTTGFIYVSDRAGGPASSGALIRVDPESGEQTVVSSGGDLFMPEDVEIGSSGEILVLGPQGLVEVDPISGDQLPRSTTAGAGLTRLPLGVSLPKDGDPIVVRPSPPTVLQVDRSSGDETVVGSAADLMLPRGVSIRYTQLVNLREVHVADAGNLSAVDGKVILIDVLRYNAGSPEANQTVVASGGNLVDPFDLSLDLAGNIYVVDPAAAFGSGAVIRVDGSGDQLVLSSGDQFVHPVAIEVYPMVQAPRIPLDLFVADPSVSAILRVDPDTGEQSTLASGDLLVEPVGVLAQPGSDALFVADRHAGDGDSGAVIRVNTSSGAQTLLSSGQFLSDPERLAFAPDGSLLVVDSLLGGVVRVNVDNGDQSLVADGIGGAVAIAVTGDGTAYVLSALTAQLFELDLANGNTRVVGDDGFLEVPRDVVAELDGNLLVADFRGKVIRVRPGLFDVSDPGGNQDLLSEDQSFLGPMGIALTLEGRIVVSDPQAGTLFTVNAFSGRAFVLATGSPLIAPEGMGTERVTVRPGDILVADRAAIVLVDPSTGAQATLTAGGLLGLPDGLAVEADGSIVAADLSQNAVIRVDARTGTQSIVTTGGNILSPGGVRVAEDGTLFVSVQQAPFPIVRVDPVSGDQTIIASNLQDMPGGTGEFRFEGLKKLAIDPANGDLIATTDVVGVGVSGERILRVDPGVRPLPATPDDISTDPLLFIPNEVVVEEPGGDLLVANGRDVLRVNPLSGAAAVLSSDGLLLQAHGLVREADGSLLVSSIFGDSVVRIDPQTGEQELVSFGGRLALPRGLAVIPTPEPAAELLSLVALAAVAALRRGVRSRARPTARSPRSARRGARSATAADDARG